MERINKEYAKKLVEDVSLAISEGSELPVVKLTKIFDFVLQDESIMLTVEQVKSRCNVGTTTVYEWFKRGLKKTPCGGTKIMISDLEQFIAEGKA